MDKYRINVLLQMARVTTDEEKKNEYLNTIELLLESPSKENYMTERDTCCDTKFMDIVMEFVNSFESLDMICGVKTETIYNKFVEFCIEEGNNINVNKIQFGKYFHKATGLQPKLIHRGSEYYRVYVKE
jgi:hypothetical protein